ncbi:MAG TPA: hypothetical protein VN977_09485 [Candidatus Binatia bacterium]|nr:hypothetical protein [Candidatus Binatia bacterium]
MIPRRPVAALLVLVLSTLGALANASPPDPGWIGGFYDAADGDDVVLAVIGLDQAPPLAPLLDVEPGAIHVGPVALPTRPAERALAHTAPAVRAPPPA